MPQLIRKPAGGKAELAENGWTLIAADADTAAELPGGDIIVPLCLWRDFAAELDGRNSRVGVWLDSDQHPELIAADLDKLQLVALNFPKFRDGRAFTYARLLRERYGFTGEIRAIGNVLQDQIFYMSRVGFDSFDLDPAHDPQAALAVFEEFSVTYQGDVSDPRPLYRRA